MDKYYLLVVVTFFVAVEDSVGDLPHLPGVAEVVVEEFLIEFLLCSSTEPVIHISIVYIVDPVFGISGDYKLVVEFEFLFSALE